MYADRLDAAIRAVCPIVGVSLEKAADKRTWRIQFAAGATDAQKVAAQAVLDAFDTAAADAAEAARAARLATDEQEAADARTTAAIVTLLDATPAQRIAWAQANFPTLTAAEGARMGMLLNILAVAARQQVRR